LAATGFLGKMASAFRELHMTSIDPLVPRPPLAFRVGVSGALDLSSAPVETLRRQIDAFFSLVATELTRLAKKAAPYYDKPAAGQPPFSLRLISPLAEGADRLVAEEAQKFSVRLHVPLPFPQREFEEDFPDTVQDFRALLQGADKLELDGAHSLSRAEASYLEGGRFVVRNCDILIAIWDGLPARGKGGTGDVVQFAAQFGAPIWHIDVSGAAPPRLITNAAEFRHPEKAAAGEAAEAALKQYLKQLTSPPPSARGRHESLIGFLAYQWRRLSGRDETPLKEFLGERPLPRRIIWRSFDFMTSLLAPGPASAPRDSMPNPALPAEIWWQKFYSVADDCSLAYRDRYRSSYVLIAMLAILALFLAAFAGLLDVSRHLAIIGVELAVLLLIGALVFLNYLHRWHERWISYRLLAEICRKQRLLSGLGFCLPRSEVTRLAIEGRDSEEPAHLPHEAWVAWYFAAVLRAAPPLTGSFAKLKPHALEGGRALAAGQIAYHDGRRAKNRRVGRQLATLGEAFFVLTFVLSVVKFLILTFETEKIVEILGVVGAAVSALSGAFVGIRAYSEFSLLARESTHMLGALKDASVELDSIEVDEPLASQELGQTLFSLTTAMMQDIAGWAQLFRVKNVEAG
jgi:hypothetical protein